MDSDAQPVEIADAPQSVSPRAEQRMAFATLVSRAAGFIRVTAIAAVLGTTELATAFTQANAMSNVLFELLAAGALSAALVPPLVRALDEQGLAAMERLARAMLGMALSVLTVVVLVGVLFRWQIAQLLTSSTPAESREPSLRLIAYWLCWFLPQVLMYAFASVAIAVLTVRRRLVAIGIAPIGNTVVLITGLLAARFVHGTTFQAGSDGLEVSASVQNWLGFAGTGGVFAFVAIPVWFSLKEGVRLRPMWGWNHQEHRRVLRASSWAVFQSATVGVLLLCGNIAAARHPGGAHVYAFALACFYAPYAVFAQPIQAGALPDLARLATTPPAFASRLSEAMERTIGVTLVVALSAFGFAEPAIRAVLFGATSTNESGAYVAALLGLLVGLPMYSLFFLLSRAESSRGRTRNSAGVSFVSALIGGAAMIGGSSLASGTWTLAAVGAGATIAWVLACVWLVSADRTYRAALRQVNWAAICRKSVIPGLAIGIAVRGIDNWTSTGGSRVVDFALAGLGALATAAIGLHWLRRGAS
jgi:putative peptidoglycan lipid II flippase